MPGQAPRQLLLDNHKRSIDDVTISGYLFLHLQALPKGTFGSTKDSEWGLQHAVLMQLAQVMSSECL